MNVYESLQQYLTNNGVSFKEITHAVGDTAEAYHQAVGCKYEQQLKCLLIRAKGDSGKYYAIVTIPANKRLDLNDLKEKIKAKELRLANKDELKQVTGCNFGELPPFAKLFKLSLIMDKDFLNEQEVYLNAGKVDVSFVVSPIDLQRVEQPTMI